MAYFIARYRGSETGEVAFECDPPEVDENDENEDETLIRAAEAAIPAHVSLDDVEIYEWPCGGCGVRVCAFRSSNVHRCAHRPTVGA